MRHRPSHRAGNEKLFSTSEEEQRQAASATSHSQMVDGIALEWRIKKLFQIIEEKKRRERRISQGITVSKLSFKGHKEAHPQSLQFGDNA